MNARLHVRTGTSGLGPLDGPADVGDGESLGVAKTLAVIKVNGVLDPISLAASLAVEADVDDSGLAGLKRTGSGGDTKGHEGSGEGGDGELHFEFGGLLRLEDPKVGCLEGWNEIFDGAL
jgi:hypothetical protein